MSDFASGHSAVDSVGRFGVLLSAGLAGAGYLAARSGGGSRAAADGLRAQLDGARSDVRKLAAVATAAGTAVNDLEERVAELEAENEALRKSVRTRNRLLQHLGRSGH